MTRSQYIALTLAIATAAMAFGMWFYFRGEYSYQHPGFFWILLAVPVAGIYHFIVFASKNPQVKLSSLHRISEKGALWTEISVQIPFLLRMVGLSMLVIALARPQSQLSWQDVTTEGIDIAIAMDISASMLAQDFRPNRLEKSKEVAIEFIRSRPNDRIGLVVYEGESFTQCPLTSDHRVLINLFKDLRTGMVQGGTAIGMGLATAVNRLRESEAKSKVIILMTDGENNAGSVDPLTAAEIAKSYGIRVYTIGVGTKGRAKSPVAIYPDGSYKYDMVEVKINDEMLTEIANMTGGAYYRATDGDALERIFTEIDTLEKTKINVTEHRRKKEEYFYLLAIGAGLLFIEFLYKQLYLKTLP